MTRHTTCFEDRAAAVRAWAQGWLPTEAAAELLIGYQAWLLREDFWRVAVDARWMKRSLLDCVGAIRKRSLNS